MWLNTYYFGQKFMQEYYYIQSYSLIKVGVHLFSSIRICLDIRLGNYCEKITI